MSASPASMIAERALSDGFRFYHYDPSVPAAILFAALFAVITVLHIYQSARTRTWFMIPFVLGGLFETIGYIGRAVSANQKGGEDADDYTLGPYIVQSILILVAPALLAASVYMSLGRTVLAVEGDKFLFIRRRWLTGIFVTVDVFSFFVQGAGGGLLAQDSKSSRDTGEKLILAGLFIQIVVFGLFIIVSAFFHARMHRNGTSRSYEVPWTKHMIALYIVSALIFIRSIFRAIEYLDGQEGFLLSKEVFLYVFDSVLMFIAMICLNWIHPSEIKSYLKGGRWSKGFQMKQTDSVVSQQSMA